MTNIAGSDSGEMFVRNTEGQDARKVMRHTLTIRMSDEDVDMLNAIKSDLSDHAASLGLSPVTSGQAVRSLIMIKYRNMMT